MSVAQRHSENLPDATRDIGHKTPPSPVRLAVRQTAADWIDALHKRYEHHADLEAARTVLARHRAQYLAAARPQAASAVLS